MISFVFDMDGTIVDSRRAVREAYRKAGMELPDEAWGKAAHEWGCPPEVHEMKTAIYPTILLRMGRRLHAADLLATTRGEVLTGASLSSVNAVRKFLRDDFHVLASGCSHDQKISYLQEYDHRVIYVDDDYDFGKRAMREVPNLLFLHVARHEGVFHLHSQKGAQRWTLSSWLPDVTIV